MFHYDTAVRHKLCILLRHNLSTHPCIADSNVDLDTNTKDAQARGMPPGRQGMHTLSLDLFSSLQLQNQPHGSEQLVYTDLKSKHVSLALWETHTACARWTVCIALAQRGGPGKLETMCRATGGEGQQIAALSSLMEHFRARGRSHSLMGFCLPALCASGA